MPKRLSTEKRPTDVNQLAHYLGEQITAAQPTEAPKEAPKPKAPSRSEISRIMAAMGRKGGKKSAKARMEKISPEQRSEIAANAARAMWAKRKSKSNASNP